MKTEKLLLLFILNLLLIFSANAQNYITVEEGIYTIKSKASNRLLNVSNSSINNNANVDT